MELLIISPGYPPILAPESLCVGKLVRALTAQGVGVTVVCQDVTGAGWHSDAAEFWKPGPDRVHRLPPPRPSRRAASLMAKARWMDGNTSWFGPAAIMKCRELLQRQKFDFMMSRAPNGDAFHAARLLKREFGIKWICNFDDPFPYFLLPEPYGKGRASTWLDRRLLARLGKMSLPEHVTFPCARLRDYTERAWGVSFGHRSGVVPHIGWRGEPAPSEDGLFEILHTGGVGPQRVSEPLLQGFSRAFSRHPGLRTKVRISFLGVVHDSFQQLVRKHNLTDVFIFDSIDTYPVALGRVSRASALLLIEARLEEGIFLPSKFADYAVSGAPLLCYSPENGTIADLVGGHAHPGFLGQSEETCGEAINRLFDRLKREEDLSDYAYPRPDDFSPERVARELLSRL
jgi:glycosyltransferase involved in cell wall biosynthesis